MAVVLLLRRRLLLLLLQLSVAWKPSLVTEPSDVNCTSIVVPDATTGPGTDVPCNLANRVFPVELPSKMLT